MRRFSIVTVLSWSFLLALVATAAAGTTVVGNGDATVLDNRSPKARALTGTVVASETHWHDGRIVTTARVRADDGSELELSQIGGTIGELTTIQIPGQPIARTHDQVTLLVEDAHDKRDGGQPRVLEVLWVTAGESQKNPVSRTPENQRKFVRTTNDRNVPLYWNYNCVHITYDSAGTTDLDGDTEFQVMDSVFQTWRDTTASCSYLTFVIEESAPVELALDRVNIVKFLEEEWGPVGCTTNSAVPCYHPDAAAITTVSFINSAGQERSGEIVDADIELNGAHFAISDQDVTNAPPQLCKSDLANTLTHEVGHLMGLDHTCVGAGFSPGFDPDGNPKPWPQDHNGEDVPFCGAGNPPEVRDSTMNAFQNCGETAKASPEQDDIDAVCAVYPGAEDPGTCRIPDSTSGRRTCACRLGTAGNDSPVSPLLPMALLAAALLWRQRRRQTTSPEIA